MNPRTLDKTEHHRRAEVRQDDPHFTLASGAPKVSVILPTFNRPAMLREALESILGQTLRDFEVIVVNDAGLDVEDVIARLKQDRRVVYFQHTVNKGLAAARNTGLRVARGKYIAYLDDDDIYYPTHLETLVRFAESGGYSVVYSDALRATLQRTGGTYVITERAVTYSNDFDYDFILVNNLMPVLCVLHERACLDKAGGFNEKMTTHEDWDLWIRMSRHFRFAHLREITCEFRWCEDGTTMTSSRRSDFYRTAKIIYARYRAHVRGKPLLRKAQRVFLAAYVQRFPELAWRKMLGLRVRELWLRVFGGPLRLAGK
jgi:O-antigen biosynthesis protein